MRYFLAAYLLLLLIFPFGLSSKAQADSYDQVEGDVRDNARNSIERLRSLLDDGEMKQNLQREYGLDGNNWTGTKYRPHQWAEGNPEWEQVWKEQQTETIRKGFNQYFDDCYAFKNIGRCCEQEPCCYDLVGYWWPETVVTVNNYCISSLIGPEGSEFSGGCLGESKTDVIYEDVNERSIYRPDLSWTDAKDVLLNERNPIYGKSIRSKVLEEGAQPLTDWPNPELRENPHNRQSHTDETGFHSGLQQRSYEAHAFRSWLDILASEGKFRPPVPGARCFASECAAPFRRNKRFTKMWSEDTDHVLPIHWRIAENSNFRTGWNGLPQNRPYHQLWIKSAAYGLLPSLPGENYNTAGDRWALFHPLEYPSPSRAVQEAQADLLSSNTCGSFRGSSSAELTIGWQSPIVNSLPDVRLPIEVQRDQNLLRRLKRNCLATGQVYPIIGRIEEGDERIATVIAARRFLEWSSYPGWVDKRRSNHFSDWSGDWGRYWGYDDVGSEDPNDGQAWSNIMRWIPHLSNGHADRPDEYFHIGTPPDKLQRLYPKSREEDRADTCFTMDKVDLRRHPELFPKDLYLNKFDGETSFAFWNWRTCCIFNPAKHPSCAQIPEGAVPQCMPRWE